MSFRRYPNSSASANPSIGTGGGVAPTSATEVGGKSPSGKLVPIAVDELGNQSVHVLDSALPAGASTSALQTAGNTSLASVDSKLPAQVSGTVPVSLPAAQISALAPYSAVAVTNFPATQPVSAAALPLPSGASTAANQATEITALQSIDTKTPALQSGAVPVSLPAAQITALMPLSIVNIGNLPATYTDNIAQFGGTAVSLGQKNSAASIPVVMASDQIQQSPKGRSSVLIYRNDYTGNGVGTAAYNQVVASTSALINELEIFDSSGQTMVLAVGAAGSENNVAYIFPGGNGRIPLSIPAGSRVSIKAVSAIANVGEIDINFYS